MTYVNRPKDTEASSHKLLPAPAPQIAINPLLESSTLLQEDQLLEAQTCQRGELVPVQLEWRTLH